MSTIFYGGTKKTIEKQRCCAHKWHGPCIDEVSRYFKCAKCFVMDRDCTEAEYWELTSKPFAEPGKEETITQEPPTRTNEEKLSRRLWLLYELFIEMHGPPPPGMPFNGSAAKKPEREGEHMNRITDEELAILVEVIHHVVDMSHAGCPFCLGKTTETFRKLQKLLKSACYTIMAEQRIRTLEKEST